MDARNSWSVLFERLPAGLAGTYRTLDVMAQAVRGELPPDRCGYRDERVRRLAINVCRSIQGHDDVGSVAALFFFVRDRIRYRRDPIDTERVQDPCQTVALASGDCDDLCTLLAALLASLGYLPRFVAQKQASEDFDHVYVEVFLRGNWCALDPTADGLNGMPRAHVGWRAPAREEWTFAIFT